MFRNHLRKDGDFRKLGYYIVKDIIFLAHCDVLHEVNLGSSTFKEPFISHKSNFGKNFDCSDSVFEKGIYFRETGMSGDLIYEGVAVR